MEQQSLAPNSLRKDDERIAAVDDQSKDSSRSSATRTVLESLARGSEFVGAPAVRAMDSATTRIRSLEEELSRLERDLLRRKHILRC